MLYGAGYNLEPGTEENEQSIISSMNRKGSMEEAPSSSRKKRPRSASKGREVKKTRVRKTIPRKAQRSKVSCRRSPSPSELEESESEESESEERESEERETEDEDEDDEKVDNEDNEDDDEDGSPTKNSLPIHFEASDLKNVDVDVDGSHLIPLDFVYQKKIREGSTENQLKLVPLKSKMVIGKNKNKKIISKVIHIKKMNHFNNHQHLANINKHYVNKKMISAANNLTAKELKKEIIQNPKEFLLVELSEKNETKINNKVSKLQTDNKFKFMQIIRKDDKNTHTGKFFDLF